MGHQGSLTAQRADGSTFPIEASISRVGLNGRHIYAAIVRDIAQRQRSEEALRASEFRYRLLFETMVHGVVHQDRTGAIVAMNPAAERILGKTRDEFLGLTSEAVEHHTLRADGTPFPGAEHPSMLALRTGQSGKGVLMQVWNSPLGEYRLISIDAVPLFKEGSPEPHEVNTTFETVCGRTIRCCQPPAIAPTMRNGSRPAATAAGSGTSGD